ncbi:MAG: amidophosphoribosyltransferase [Planctomycetota bacterium]
MCGVIGIVGKASVAQSLYDGLLLLQHRGQDAAGMVTGNDEGQIFTRKSLGLVRDVFQQRHMERLSGNMGIGHLRYPTAGTPSVSESQPFYVNSPFGISFAHNGNLTNAEELRDHLIQKDKRHLNTTSDSEVLLNVLANEMQSICTSPLTPDDLFHSVRRVHNRVKGGYSVVAMIAGRGILAFRDPHGIRPLCYGERETSDGKKEYMVASESVALRGCGFELVRDIKPGEAVYFGHDGKFFEEMCIGRNAQYQHQTCMFEYVYFARPDSMIEGISVHRARMRMGEKLAEKIKREWSDHDIDVVVPIPDTSRTSALEIAHCLDVKYREGLIKNRYIGRTFIMPGQEERRLSVLRKLSPIELEFENKNVLLVDDSIVRGTTSQQIVQMVRKAGAKRVYMASAAPPVRHPNVYGIDMPKSSELVAHNKSIDEINLEIGSDRLIYQDLDDLIEAVRFTTATVQNFDCSCFDGNYVTGDVTESYLKRLEMLRSDEAKAKMAQSIVDDAP